ncbi:MAG: endolytic transglycosylase MltG [Oscillospiraceae bacterium]|nr:endolytic transglycosylase MltG [Oscillospiraceae bacterium]
MDENKEKDTKAEKTSAENIPEEITDAESENTLHSGETASSDDKSDINSIIEEYSEYEDKKAAENTDASESTDKSEVNGPEISDDDDFEDEPEEKHPPKPKKKKRRKKGNGRLIFGLIMTALIVAVAVFCAAFVLKFARDFVGIGKSSVEVVVEIPMNSGTADIADILANEGIIDSTYFFRFYSRIKGSDGTFVAGSHVLTPDMSYENIVHDLQQGAVDTRESVDITFPEGIDLLDAAQKLEENNVCSASDFIREFNNSSFGFDFEKLVKVSAMKFYKMEGYLFPDTYTFYVEEDPKIVCKKIYRNFETRITPDIYARMDDLGLEFEEMLTMASMVQAEASSVYDMKRVASVFRNRLADPDNYPLLQSDPTRKYVEDVIKPNIEFPSKEMFKAYNTYEGAGLPPGPICNPGLDAINAVLYPADTDYYYFCANVDTGEVYYARTNEEHEANLVLAGIK